MDAKQWASRAVHEPGWLHIDLDALRGHVAAAMEAYAREQRRAVSESAPAIADRILDGIAMEPAIRAELKKRIVAIFGAMVGETARNDALERREG